MSEVINEHRDIINMYADRIAETCTESEMRNVAMALLAHLSYLLGRESLRNEGEQE